MFCFLMPPLSCLQQLYTLWQATGTRVADISGIFLTHAHMGHYLGLAYLGKEAISADRVPVYVMPRFKQFLETNGPWSQLVSEQNIVLKTLTHDQLVDVADVQVKPFKCHIEMNTVRRWVF